MPQSTCLNTLLNQSSNTLHTNPAAKHDSLIGNTISSKLVPIKCNFNARKHPVSSNPTKAAAAPA